MENIYLESNQRIKADTCNYFAILIMALTSVPWCDNVVIAFWMWCWHESVNRKRGKPLLVSSPPSTWFDNIQVRWAACAAVTGTQYPKQKGVRPSQLIWKKVSTLRSPWESDGGQCSDQSAAVTSSWCCTDQWADGNVLHGTGVGALISCSRCDFVPRWWGHRVKSQQGLKLRGESCLSVRDFWAAGSNPLFRLN